MLHFLPIGRFIFVTDCLLATRDDQGERIVVRQAAVEALAREHPARWMRPPAGRGLARLLDALVLDAIDRDGHSQLHRSCGIVTVKMSPHRFDATTRQDI